YAQAEDRLEDIYRNVRTAIGEMSAAFGPSYVRQDYIMKAVKNGEHWAAYWPTAPEHIRALGDAFVAGVEAYVAEHPERRPGYALDLEGWHCGAVGSTMILKWPLGTVEDDLKNKDQAPPFGSNGWAVGPSRSAEGCSIVMTDPHLTWKDLAVFYEARVHGGDLAMNGFFLVGTPVLALGNNGRVGWACTTGGPDTSDVYVLKLNPDNPLEYEYDGAWKQAQIETITIEVKDADPVEQMAAYTELGFLLGEPDLEKGIAYVGATPYFGQTGLLEQMYKMALARNCGEFYEALAMNQFMEQNLIFADVEGNIQYVRAGRTPIRPEGYNWNAPVPGNTSATKWLGIHDIADLVQIKNPPQGYFQNCNISPALMMLDSPLTPDKYPAYVYNVSWDKSNPRGRRALELLSGDDSITREEAMAVAMDVYDALSKPWQSALRGAVDAVGAERMQDAAFAKAVEDVLAWNGEFTPDSVAAPIVRSWRLKCAGAVDVAAIAKGEALSREHQAALLELLGQTLAELRVKYGESPVTWGDIHKVGRGGILFPCPCADFGDGANATETLMDVGTREDPPDSGIYVARKGSMAMMLMFCVADGIEAYSCIPWGQSADPASPHYMDQGEKLYSRRKFKPAWFDREELLGHVESEKVLQIP
ncbi:MAG: penicillin acylase family protein, partial [Candidatus Hydrogenedentes bacterium]|nr:penicillin acylase family protein [Candidatus Hydrogenedentota bacterium]